MQRPRIADLIAFALTDDIIGRRLPPGSALDEGSLGRRFGASRTPVREALRELSASGLVELRPHRAPIVVAIDEARVAEMFEAMVELEVVCARLASQAMTPEQRATLTIQHDSMGELVRRGDVTAYRAENVVFHALLYAGAQNSYLREMAQATRARLGPYRGAQLEAPQRVARSYAEHDAIVVAVMRGDAERAEAVMRSHLEATRATFSRLVAQA